MKYSKEGSGAYGGPECRVYCPYCNYPGCEADWVDVGVGMVQCGPYHCPECGASEIGSHDTNEASEEEKRVGWYRAQVGSSANTFQGTIIDHTTAKALYRAGVAINQHREEGADE